MSGMIIVMTGFGTRTGEVTPLIVPSTMSGFETNTEEVTPLIVPSTMSGFGTRTGRAKKDTPRMQRGPPSGDAIDGVSPPQTTLAGCPEMDDFRQEAPKGSAGFTETSSMIGGPRLEMEGRPEVAERVAAQRLTIGRVRTGWRGTPL